MPLRLSPALCAFLVGLSSCATARRSEAVAAPHGGGGSGGNEAHNLALEMPAAAHGDSGAVARASNDGRDGQVHAAAAQRRRIRDADVGLIVDDESDIEPAISRIGNSAEALGGYLVHASSRSVSVKVPEDKLDVALTWLDGVGEISHKNIQTRDVTAEYVDLGIRIDNLQRSRKRLQALLDQGGNVKDLVEVERELRRVTSELESLYGQRRLLENQTTFATMSVTFKNRVSPGPVGWVFYALYVGVKWLFVWD